MEAAPPYLERRILGLTLFFLVFGLIIVFSATAVLGVQSRSSEFYYVTRQAICAATGLAVMWILSRIPYQTWERVALWGLGLQLVLTAAVFVPPLANPVQGVSRWIRIGPITFQPSELAKITLAIFMARVVAQWKTGKIPVGKAFTQGIPCLLILALIYRQPDLGSTVLLITMAVGMIFVAGARPAYMVGSLGTGALLFGLALLRSDYRKRRLLAFLNPWADPQGSGFQSIQSYLSFHSGKIIGVGIGNGNSKLFHLPEVHTDFIYALIGEELGFVGAVTLLLLFAYFGFLLFKVVRHAPDAFGQSLAFAMAFSLLAQIAVNLGGVTGLLPVKGLPLPFISWGRSALLVNLAMVGLLLNVVRQASARGPAGGRTPIQSPVDKVESRPSSASKRGFYQLGKQSV